MNQDNNQLNQNSFNIQGNNGIPNNQPLGNQNTINQAQLNNVNTIMEQNQLQANSGFNNTVVQANGFIQQPIDAWQSQANVSPVNNNSSAQPGFVDANPSIQSTITTPSVQQNVMHMNSGMQPTIATQAVQQNTIPAIQNNQPNMMPVNQNMGINMVPDNQTVVQPNSLQGGNQMPQQNVSYVEQQTASNSASDEELLKAFIGKNYEKITTRKFNFASFFFASFYMFYRKMFGYGLLIFVINLIILNFINSSISQLIYLAFLVIVGFLTNKIYLQQAKKKIDKIKLKNSSKDINEIKVICSAKGGTSVGRVFLGFFVEVAIAIIFLIIMMIVGLSSTLGSLINGFDVNNNNNNIGDNISKDDATYSGMIMYNSSINMADEFTITVPSVFENNSENYEYNYEYESGQGIFNSCSVSLIVPEGYSSANNLINQMAAYHSSDNPTAVATEKINDIDWYWFSYTDTFGTTYYYGTTKNNNVYLLEYSIEEDVANDCANYRQPILESINKK